MRRNVVWLLAILLMCGTAVRLWEQPSVVPEPVATDTPLPLLKRPERDLSIDGVRLGTPSSELVRMLGRPTRASGRLLKFAEAEVVLDSDSRVVWVRGWGLRENWGRPRDPREVLRTLPGFTAFLASKQCGGQTTLYWPELNLRVDMVSHHCWNSTHTLAIRSMIRTLPKGVKPVLPF